MALASDLYCRAGHGEPEDVAAVVRGAGGLPDNQVVGGAAGSAAFLHALPTSNGRIGVIGSCSGGRHAYLAACRSDAFAAAVDLWGFEFHRYPGAGHGFFYHSRPAAYRAEQAVDGCKPVGSPA